MRHWLGPWALVVQAGMMRPMPCGLSKDVVCLPNLSVYLLLLPCFVAVCEELGATQRQRLNIDVKPLREPA